MALSSILIFILFGLLTRLLLRGRLEPARPWVLFLASALAVYALQPATPIRYLDYWLPTLTLALAALGWALTAKREAGASALALWRANWQTAAALGGLALLVALTRYLGDAGLLTPSRPPAIEQALIAVALAALLAFLALRAGWGALPRFHRLLWAVIGLLVALLVLIISPPLAQSVAAGLRSLMDQSTALAAATDLRWLGFSYVAFRLVHTLRERQNGRLPAVSLREYLTYVIFYPAFTAGPIDKIDRFVKDLRRPLTERNAPADWAAAGQRLALGLLKKFVVADGLALVALNASSAAQVQGAGWAWLLLYAYALQIYFDFSGYTDIAIGLARLVGIALPENFNAPYLKPNLTQFWNSWHMTLTNWVRAYYFNPVNRWLRTRKLRREGREPLAISPTAILFFTQVTTMLLIGLWHGVTLNFAIWGAWHGLGLFVQNRFSEWMRPRYESLETRPRLHTAVTALTTLLTFQYVALGWVWFALPDPSLAGNLFAKLFGR